MILCVFEPAAWPSLLFTSAAAAHHNELVQSSVVSRSLCRHRTAFRCWPHLRPLALLGAL